MLAAALRDLILIGRLTIIDADGRSASFGTSCPGEGPDVVVRLKGALTAAAIALDPDRFLGEAYMNGELVLEQGTLWDLLELCGLNLQHRQQAMPGLLPEFMHRLLGSGEGRISRGLARRNVAHHYDLSETLYRLFLDEDLQYSCAYFREPGLSLADAQAAKKHHIAAKLCLEPGQRVLDIGCGWGGLALSLAQSQDVEILGITLSREQLAVARDRAQALGLADRVRFELRDYRDVAGAFDRIVSVGMFEHVGVKNYPVFFEKLTDSLTDGGLALVHSIGRMAGPARTSSWIRRYIFPGGYIPSLSEIMPVIEDARLWLTDLEILRLHYAETLRHWRARFLQKRDLAAQIYDERFCRMWEFYLAASEMSFRYLGLMVFQAQITKSISTAPLTRDYMSAAEGRYADAATSEREELSGRPILAAQP